MLPTAKDAQPQDDQGEADKLGGVSGTWQNLLGKVHQGEQEHPD